MRNSNGDFCKLRRLEVMLASLEYSRLIWFPDHSFPFASRKLGIGQIDDPGPSSVVARAHIISATVVEMTGVGHLDLFQTAENCPRLSSSIPK